MARARSTCLVGVGVESPIQPSKLKIDVLADT